MKVITNGSFSYDPEYNEFKDNIAVLDVYDRYEKAYKFIHTLNNYPIKIILKKGLVPVFSCDLCYNLIHNDVYCVNTYHFHQSCADIISRMVYDVPITTIKLNIGNTIDILPIYGCINDYFISRNKGQIELYQITYYMDQFNVYDCIYGVMDKCETIIDECDNCGDISASINHIINHQQICTNCVSDYVRFTDKLILIHKVIRGFIVPDVSCAIVKMIIDIYVK